MSEVTPPRSAARRLPSIVLSGVLVAVTMVGVQWRLPGLPVLAPTGITALIVLGFALLLLRQARREAALVGMLRQEISRRDAAETALQQGRTMAAIGRLARGLAHDFNNHLTAISSNIELLARRLPPGAWMNSRPRCARRCRHGSPPQPWPLARVSAFT